jgi:hypothetical protein
VINTAIIHLNRIMPAEGNKLKIDASPVSICLINKINNNEN